MARPDDESDSNPDVTLPDTDPRERPAPAAVDVGTVLGGRYYLEALLGRGGSGVVFRGADRVLGETVAIKILHPDRARQRSWIKRLFREVKVARAIRHPNVCRVFELGEADGHWFITMELASGTLRQRLEQPEPRPWARRLEDARAVCNGLSAIHAVGITHRDVTPQNVLCMSDGRLVISDFGLALADTETTTMYGGTPNYMPPEVLHGQRSDQRSDVWQLGVVLHEILFGQRPIWEQRADRSILQPPPTGEVSVVVEEMGRLVADCLASMPEQRPGSAVAVAGRLAAAEAARPRGWVVRKAMRARFWVKRRRTPLLAGLTAAVLLTAAARFIQVSQRPLLCRGAPERTAAAWSPVIKAKIASAFRATGKPYAADALAGVTGTLDDYIRRWTGMYVDACEATHIRGDQSADVLDLRMTCLGDRLEEVSALARVLTNADATAVQNAPKAAADIRSLDHCADVRTLRSGIQPPKDPDLRRRVEALRLELIHVRTLEQVGAWSAGSKAAAALVASARNLGYAPLYGQTLLISGRLSNSMMDGVAAQPVLEEAASIADSSRDDATVVEASVFLVYAAGHLRGKYEVADVWARRADSALQRMGDDPILRSWLLNNVGMMRSAQGRHEEALVNLEKSVALKIAARGEDHFDVAYSLTNLALSLHQLGRDNEAVAATDRAQPIYVAGLGPEHPVVARNLANRAESLLALGRLAEARADLEKGLKIVEREPEINGVAIADLLATLGSCDLAEGKTAAAIARLQKSVRLFREADAPGDWQGRPLFELAKATWLEPTNRTQAIAHAVGARDEYRRFGRTKEATEIDTWLSTHRGSARTTAH